MYNFLSFNTFITQDVLVVFYYIGAVLVPFFLYKYNHKLTKKSDVLSQLESRPKVLLTTFGIFLLLELFWRMFFEMLIGYFDMHEYLYDIATHLQYIPQ